MTKHQLYLKCQYCHTYFHYNGGKRSSVCSSRCKVAKWRLKKLSPPPLEYVDMSDPKVLLDNSVNSKNASVRHEWRKKKSFMVDGESLRTYDDNGKLTSVQGMNKNGEYGIWIDTEGLCPHERIKQYCEDCNE